MNKCIGIVSYLPDDKNIREHRWIKLTKLIAACDRLFDLPILIIAQNWKNLELNDSHVTLYSYRDKLGIVGARKELRKIFLESSYDYLIMLDDDCYIQGDSADRYFKQIEKSPDCFIEFNKTSLKLFAISKTIFEKVDYENINPELGEGFEDRIFVNKLRKLFPEAKRTFNNVGITQWSIPTYDEDSTWYCNQDIDKMLENTERKIKEL